jgi:transketolase
MTPTHHSLARDALAVRRQFLQMHFNAKAGHIGTGLSAIDLLVYLHRTWLRPQDTFVLSKGHGASALYATLHHVGKLSDAELATYYQDGTLFPAHPAARGHASIPIATGSLGHGLPVSCGLAYARRILDGSDARVACMLSDGECNEGSVWEAVMFAAHHRLENLLVIIDANGLQGFGRTQDVLNMEPMADRWRAFGFAVEEINGHDFAAIDGALSKQPSGPTCLIARTVKGKGVSFFEDTLESHYLPLDAAQYATALADLAKVEAELASAGCESIS